MQNKKNDVIPLHISLTLDGLFRERVRRSPDKVAYRQYDEPSQTWFDSTWLEVNEQVNRLRTAFTLEKLAHGDRVAIMLRNCREWIVYDQAALSLGLVVVPLFTNDRAENIAYILNDANVKVLLIEGQEHWDTLCNAHDQLFGLVKIISVNRIENCDDPRVIPLQEWLPDTWGEWAVYDDNSDRLASIVYTSGTTGKPKGVMLSHYNILWNAHAGTGNISVYADDLFLSFLPLSHMLERTVGYYLTMTAGATVAFARSIPLLSEDLMSQKPTVLVSVPRIFERIYGNILSQLETKSSAARKLFKIAVDTGWLCFEYQQGRKRWHPRLLLWPALFRLVARKVHVKLGGKLRFAICGGAALAPHIGRAFIGLGLPIAQGYGLTETSPVLTVNPLDNNEPASVGTLLNSVKARIGDDDELIVKSPGVMLGYWNNELATADVIDSDGWFHTGDKARIVNHHVYITGRIKEILVLANGEKVSPVDMEAAILDDALFDQCIVIGEAKPYLSALIVLNTEQWPNFAKSLDLNPDDHAGLNDDRLREACLRRVSRSLSEFPGYAQIHTLTLTLETWTVENNMLTPTLKTRRGTIMEHYRDAIDKMYLGH